MNTDPARMIAATSAAAARHKSTTTAYVLWFFFGGLGVHRLYAGDTGYGLGMMFTLGGVGVWTLIDVFLIGDRVRRVNEEITAEEYRRHGVTI